MGFLIYLGDNLFLVYRNITDFCTLIMYSAALLNSFISSNSLLVESLRFLYIELYHLQTIFLPFQFGCFISFSYLTALAKTSSIVLNRSDESGHSSLFPDLREKRCVNCEFVIYSLYYIELCSFYIQFLHLLR